jgi:hypothetical protein
MGKILVDSSITLLASAHTSSVGTQETANSPAGGSGYWGAAEACGGGVGQPPMTHLGRPRSILKSSSRM